MRKKYKITITHRRKYQDGWIGAGIVEGAKEKRDVVGFRIIKNKKNIYWLDLTLSEALDISTSLSEAVNSYLLKNKKYIPNK